MELLAHVLKPKETSGGKMGNSKSNWNTIMVGIFCFVGKYISLVFLHLSFKTHFCFAEISTTSQFPVFQSSSSSSIKILIFNGFSTPHVVKSHYPR